MDFDPFNEFTYLAKRQETQFEKLKEIRHLIDPRISDSEIMVLIDMGVDGVSICNEKMKVYNEQTR